MAAEAKLELDHAHLKEPVPELLDALDGMTDVPSTELLTMLEKMDIAKEKLALWQLWSGVFNSTQDMKGPLGTVVTYAETHEKVGPKIKEKLRVVTKILKTSNDVDSESIIILLASHGGVCNVQKEVAINMAYGMLTNNLHEHMQRQTFRSLLLRTLLDLRYDMAEQHYYLETNSKTLNTHSLIGFRNKICQEIGIPFQPDEHASNYYNPQVPKFFELYCPKTIEERVDKAINGKPKKIPYETTVAWFQENSPLEDAYEFLAEVFDENTGLVKMEWLRWMLVKFEVLKGSLPPHVQKIAKGAAPVAKAAPKPATAVAPEEDDGLGQPSLLRLISDDLKMPLMVRQVSREEEKATEAQAVGLRHMRKVEEMARKLKEREVRVLGRGAAEEAPEEFRQKKSRRNGRKLRRIKKAAGEQ